MGAYLGALMVAVGTTLLSTVVYDIVRPGKFDATDFLWIGLGIFLIIRGIQRVSETKP